MLVVALLLAVGCADVPAAVESAPEQAAPIAIDHLTAHWTISDAFTPDETSAILDAADAWHVATGRVELTFDIGSTAPDAPWTITKAASDGDEAHDAETSVERNSITIDPAAVPANCVWLVAVHELGHTFWLDHTDGGVMAAHHAKTCNETITAVDVAAFDALN